MKKWKEQKAQDRLRQTADPSAPSAPGATGSAGPVGSSENGVFDGRCLGNDWEITNVNDDKHRTSGIRDIYIYIYMHI